MKNPATSQPGDPVWAYPGIVEEIDGRWTLVASHCGACDRLSFPGSAACPECYGSVEDRALAREGVVYSRTIVRMGRPGFAVPYGVAWVDFPGGVRVFGQLESEDVGIGDRVEVTAGPIAEENGASLWGHKFRKAESTDG